MAQVAATIAALLAAFHLWTAFNGVLPTMQQVYVHLGGILVLVFLTRPAFSPESRFARLRWFVDIPLAIASAVVCGYVVVNFLWLASRGAGNPVPISIVFGAILTLLLIEGARRIVGWALPILCGIFILYAFIGPYLPMVIAHRGFGIERLAATFYLSSSGIAGTPLQVSATYVAIFVIFAAFLNVSGAGNFFIDWSFAALGWLRGGPAKVAVIASSLMGTISGSAVANTVATGTFTIPMMKRAGLKPEEAGAVEAAASSGGQIVPPVMGAAAFIMVEMLGVPYSDIIVAAVFPALLYYLALFLMVDFGVARDGGKGIPRSQLPGVWSTFRQGWYLLLPLVTLIALLVFVGYTPIRAAFYATILVVAVSWVSRKTRMGPRRIFEALRDGGNAMLEVALACACAGLVVGVLMLTGMALRISGLLVQLAGGSLFILMFLTMLVSLVMGMGLPTSAVYIILATMVAPAMVQLGVEPLAAHLFVFYFGVMANITPPVAIAAFAGAAIAGADATRTGIYAFRLALAGFILPFSWVYEPALIMEGGGIEIVHAVVTALLGVLFLAASIQGYLLGARATGVQRLLLFAGAICLIFPGWISDLSGLSAAGAAVALRLWFGGIPILPGAGSERSG